MNIELPITGSPSRTETAARCQRRHFVDNILCQRPRERSEGPLVFGTVIHEARSRVVALFYN